MSCRPWISRSSIDFMSLVKIPIFDLSFCNDGNETPLVDRRSSPCSGHSENRDGIRQDRLASLLGGLRWTYGAICRATARRRCSRPAMKGAPTESARSSRACFSTVIPGPCARRDRSNQARNGITLSVVDASRTFACGLLKVQDGRRNDHDHRHRRPRRTPPPVCRGRQLQHRTEG
jgi:hypothetical protein